MSGTRGDGTHGDRADDGRDGGAAVPGSGPDGPPPAWQGATGWSGVDPLPSGSAEVGPHAPLPGAPPYPPGTEPERAAVADRPAALLRPAVFIPESKRLNVLLQEFRDSRNHMAIVVNEYGSVVGLITIEDVLEQIVGNIEDEHDIDGAAGMVLRRGSDFCVIKAMLPVESFNQLYGVELDPLEYDTMGGLVTGALGHVPRRGETITFDQFTAEVLSADSRRPRLLRITLSPADESPAE